MAINKVIYGNETLIDITDTTATDSTVLEGTVFYNAAGVRTVGSALAGISDVQDADGTSLVSSGVAMIPAIPSNVSDLINDSSFISYDLVIRETKSPDDSTYEVLTDHTAVYDYQNLITKLSNHEPIFGIYCTYDNVYYSLNNIYNEDGYLYCYFSRVFVDADLADPDLFTEQIEVDLTNNGVDWIGFHSETVELDEVVVCTCNSTADTEQKQLAGYSGYNATTLKAIVVVTFTYGNTVPAPKLKSSGSYYNIYYNNQITSASNPLYWSAGETLVFVKTSAGYQFISKSKQLSKTSELTNDSGYATQSYVDAAAASVSAAIPNVYDWALASSKPTYTYSEVGALSASTSYVKDIQDIWGNSQLNNGIYTIDECVPIENGGMIVNNDGDTSGFFVEYNEHSLIAASSTGVQIHDVANPSVATDVANKSYVDAAVASISVPVTDVQTSSGVSVVSSGVAIIPESPKVVIFYNDENGDLACNYSFSDLYDIVSANNPKVPYVAIYTDTSYNTNNPLTLHLWSVNTTSITFYSEYQYFSNGEWEALFTGDVTITYESDGSITKQEETHELSYDNYAEIRRQNGDYYDNYISISGSTGYFHLNSTIVGHSNSINTTYPIAFFCKDSGTISALNIKWFEGNYGNTKEVSGNLTSSQTLEQGFYIGTLSGDSYYSTFTLNVKRLADISEIPTTVSQLTNDAGYITSYTETDPIFSASAAASISAADISSWNAKPSVIPTYSLSISGSRITLTSTAGDSSYIDLPVYTGGVE